MANRRKTIFCDIDGTLIKHFPPSITAKNKHSIKPLKGTLDKFLQWEREGHCIVLITARKECTRNQTEKQLANAGIFYDNLIMGIGSGERYLINDKKIDSDADTAFAINIARNQGIADVSI